MKTVRVALILLCGLAAAQGRELLQSKNNYCVTEDRAILFVGPFSYNFDSDTLSTFEVRTLLPLVVLVRVDSKVVEFASYHVTLTLTLVGS